MYVECVPNRNSPPAVLLRESYREKGVIKKRTIANISKWPKAKIDALQALLREAPHSGGGPDFEIIRSRPHGHVGATLAVLRRLSLHTLFSRSPCREREIISALVVARIIDPQSKLATVRSLHTGKRRLYGVRSGIL